MECPIRFPLSPRRRERLLRGPVPLLLRSHLQSRPTRPSPRNREPRDAAHGGPLPESASLPWRSQTSSSPGHLRDVASKAHNHPCPLPAPHPASPVPALPQLLQTSRISLSSPAAGGAVDPEVSSRTHTLFSQRCRTAGGSLCRWQAERGRLRARPRLPVLSMAAHSWSRNTCCPTDR